MPLSIAFTSPGNYTIEDDGIRGNNISVVRDGSGAIYQTFAHPSDTLNFVTITSGVNLTFNVADPFGLANVTVGALGDLAASPDSIVVRAMGGDGIITLVSRSTITEGGSDASADVIAAGVVLSAVSGIGTPSNALETQTTYIEAETNTGDINLANFGQVVIGGITPDVAGLDVVSSGNINFSSVGHIFLTDTSGPSTVHGGNLSGNVTLTALGANAHLYANIDRPAVYAAGGGITLYAGRDVWLGTGMNYNNDVLATGDIRITAGGDLLLDGTSNVRTGAFGGVVGGDVIVTVGHDIRLTNTTGGQQTIEAFNGDVILTTGPDGTYFQNATFSATVQTTGNIFLNADNVTLIGGGLNTTGIGQIAVRPVTAGRPVNLGTAGDAFSTLGLSDDELDRLFTLNVSIGDANTGAVEFSAPSSPGIVANMVIESGNEIFMNAALFLPGSLTLRAGDDLHFSPTASFESTGGGLTAFVDNAQDDGGTGGVGDLGSPLTVTTNIQLNGNPDADTLRGSSANDILDGKAGPDTMIGRGGDDFYYVDNAGDVVVEGAAEGTNDRVFATVSYALGAGTYVERLSTTNTAGTGAINLTGNELANIIYGNAGTNVLDGGAGADTLVGLDGNDSYFVDSAADAIVENAAGGVNDRTFASASYVQAAGVHVERLSTTNDAGTTAINLTGNELVNILTGNAGANTLDGKGGADSMTGLGGDDWYIVDNAGDGVVEGAGQGAADRIFASASYTLGAGVQVETMSTTNNAGTGAINLNGNELANTIYGNAGANVLDGKTGVDTLVGFGGNDWYYADSALDAVVEGAAEGTNDRVFASTSYTLGAGVHVEALSTNNNAATTAINLSGNELVNTLYGNAGDNVLNGLGGSDALVGLDGQDSFAFTTPFGPASGNIDTIIGFVVADDTIRLENAVFTGLAAGALAAGAFNTGTAATEADDRILYNSATGALLFDADGVGGTAAVQFATLSGGLAMTAADFVVI